MRDGFFYLQIACGNYTGIGEAERALDDVFQFTDVSGPVVRLELCEGVWRERVRLACGCVLADKVVGQIFDVFLAFAQGRKRYGDDVQSVEEVFAETLLGNFFAQVSVRGGNDAHVDMASLVGADGAYFLILDDAQQFDLGVQGHVADFVQEYGTAVCVFE